MRLAATEYARFLDVLRSLSPQDWALPTCNTGWDVRTLAGHVTGMTHMSASLREQLSQVRAAKSRGGVFIDALTDEQVRRTANLSTGALIDQFAMLGPKAVRGRKRAPAFVRGRAMSDEQPINPPTEMERWTFGYLIDVILTRDTWMHRSDIAEVTSKPMTLTAEHDGVLVRDVAAEWASRHGQACSLTLTGPAGGTWSWGSGGPSYELDAVQFARIVSGRGEGEGLLATRVPF